MTQGIVWSRQAQLLSHASKKACLVDILLHPVPKFARVERPQHAAVLRGMDPIARQRLSDRQHIAKDRREGMQYVVRPSNRWWCWNRVSPCHEITRICATRSWRGGICDGAQIISSKLGRVVLSRKLRNRGSQLCSGGVNQVHPILNLGDPWPPYLYDLL